MHVASRAVALVAYSVSCALLHSLLQRHYVIACTSWLSVLTLGTSPYCTFVKGSLRALEFAPLVAIGVPGALRLDNRLQEH